MAESIPLCAECAKKTGGQLVDAKLAASVAKDFELCDRCRYWLEHPDEYSKVGDAARLEKVGNRRATES